MTTITKNIKAINLDDSGFYVSFNNDIGTLKAGTDIYLQLPSNAEAQHDVNVDDETIELCIEAIEFSDEQLSIMSILNSASITDVEVKQVATNLQYYIEDGEFANLWTNFSIIKDGNDYIAVKEDSGHKHYTNNLAYVTGLDLDLDAQLDDALLDRLFNSAK